MTFLTSLQFNELNAHSEHELRLLPQSRDMNGVHTVCSTNCYMRSSLFSRGHSQIAATLTDECYPADIYRVLWELTKDTNFYSDRLG